MNSGVAIIAWKWLLSRWRRITRIHHRGITYICINHHGDQFHSLKNSLNSKPAPGRKGKGSKVSGISHWWLNFLTKCPCNAFNSSWYISFSLDRSGGLTSSRAARKVRHFHNLFKKSSGTKSSQTDFISREKFNITTRQRWFLWHLLPGRTPKKKRFAFKSCGVLSKFASWLNPFVNEASRTRTSTRPNPAFPPRRHG